MPFVTFISACHKAECLSVCLFLNTTILGLSRDVDWSINSFTALKKKGIKPVRKPYERLSLIRPTLVYLSDQGTFEGRVNVRRGQQTSTSFTSDVVLSFLHIENISFSHICSFFGQMKSSASFFNSIIVISISIVIVKSRV